MGTIKKIFHHFKMPDTYTIENVINWIEDGNEQHLALLDQWCHIRPIFVIELFCKWLNTPYSQSEEDKSQQQKTMMPRVVNKMSQRSVSSILNLLEADKSLWTYNVPKVGM